MVVNSGGHSLYAILRVKIIFSFLLQLSVCRIGVLHLICKIGILNSVHRTMILMPICDCKLNSPLIDGAAIQYGKVSVIQFHS